MTTNIPLVTLIYWWESSLCEHRTQMTAPTIFITEQTIEKLKELHQKEIERKMPVKGVIESNKTSQPKK